MNRIRFFVVVGALTVVCVPALAQNQNQKPAPVQQKPAAAPVQQRPAAAPVQQRPAAIQQLQYSNQGTAQRNHVFDGSKPPPGPVHANPAPKPSMVGVPVREFKPSPKVTPTKPPPAPATSAKNPNSRIVNGRELNPSHDSRVARGIDTYKRPQPAAVAAAPPRPNFAVRAANNPRIVPSSQSSPRTVSTPVVARSSTTANAASAPRSSSTTASNKKP
jgi:hypothetical protein